LTSLTQVLSQECGLGRSSSIAWAAASLSQPAVLLKLRSFVADTNHRQLHGLWAILAQAGASAWAALGLAVGPVTPTTSGDGVATSLPVEAADASSLDGKGKEKSSKKSSKKSKHQGGVITGPAALVLEACREKPFLAQHAWLVTQLLTEVCRSIAVEASSGASWHAACLAVVTGLWSPMWTAVTALAQAMEQGLVPGIVRLVAAALDLTSVLVGFDDLCRACAPSAPTVSGTSSGTGSAASRSRLQPCVQLVAGVVGDADPSRVLQGFISCAEVRRPSG
jgi:hypothetical protein